MRGLSNFHICFEYPISVITGKNGSGKSTVLALAACAYHNKKSGFHLAERKTPYYTYSDFFIQTSEEIQPEGIELWYGFRHDKWKKTKTNPTGTGNRFQKRSKKKGGTHPDSLIPVETFRLDTESANRASSFELVLLIDDTIYEFSFTVNKNEVLEEKLVQITSTSEKTFYHRYGGKPHFDNSLTKDKFLEFAFKGTRDNQLFLTNSVSQKVERFKPVYDWFKNTLELVAPDSRFELFEHFFDKGHPLYNTMNELLPKLDTGICQLGGEEISFDKSPFTGCNKDQTSGRC